MPTILITGCSSGFGLETARCFLGRDWTVVASMRSPREDMLPASEHLRIIPSMLPILKASLARYMRPVRSTSWSTMPGSGC
jgi:NAD(P)-dependent dehydrogenase (short-subunit alcohol dehydrogenase family)